MRSAIFVAALLVLACEPDRHASPPPSMPLDPRGPIAPEPAPPPPETPPPASYPLACHEIYADDIVPEMRIEIAPDTLTAMREEATVGGETWHAATFRYESDVVPVMIRNRGNMIGSAYCDQKLQIAIDFNRENPDARWRGLRRIDLDTGHCRVLDERLALSFARDAGLPTPCANHAKLFFNGEYEGLFTNLEHVDKTFLTRNFGPAFNDGNLWKDGWELKTNEDEPNDDRTNRRWRNATDLETISERADLPQAVSEWAFESVMPATDNFWVDGWNYWLYEHPERGFLYIPRDYDKATPWSSKWITYDPLVLDSAQNAVKIVLDDPAYHALYVEEVRRMVELYDPEIARERIERWWTQILPAAADDPYLTVDPGDGPPRHLHEQMRARRTYLRERLEAE